MTEPYVISEGTMRVQDLMPAFLDELRELNPAAHAQLMSGPLPYIPESAEKDDWDAWWESENAAEQLLEIWELLEANAPDGLWFGSHPGDGACYGFWECEDEYI